MIIIVSDISVIRALNIKRCIVKKGIEVTSQNISLSFLLTQLKPL